MSWLGVNKQLALGLQITDESIRLVLLRQEKGRLLVVGRRLQLLPAGIVRNGLVQERELLADKINEGLAKMDLTNWRGLPTVLVLPERQAYSHTFVLPSTIGAAEIEGALALEAEGVLPIAMAETYSSFKAVGRIQAGANGGTQAYLLAAVPRTVVDVYLEVLKRADLQPVAFDLESLGQVRALFSEGNLSAKANLVVNFSERHTVISAFTPGGHLHTSVVAMLGLDDFSEKAADFWQVERSEAARRLSQAGKIENQDKLLAVFQPLITRMQAEINKAIQYYQESNAGQQIDQVLFCGLSGQLSLILPPLAELLKLPFQSCCPQWAQQSFANSTEECSVYTTVLGSARLAFLPYESLSLEINLLPQRYQQRLARDNVRSLVSAMQLIVGVFIATMLVVFVVVWSTLKIESDSLQGTNKATADILRGTRYEEINDLVNAFNSEVRLVLLTQKNGTLTSSLINDLLKSLPGGVSVQNLTWLGEEGLVELRGHAATRDSYLAFRNILEKKPYVGTVEVPLSNIAKREQLDFLLRFPLKPLPKP